MAKVDSVGAYIQLDIDVMERTNRSKKLTNCLLVTPPRQIIYEPTKLMSWPIRSYSCLRQVQGQAAICLTAFAPFTDPDPYLSHDANAQTTMSPFIV